MRCHPLAQCVVGFLDNRRKRGVADFVGFREHDLIGNRGAVKIIHHRQIIGFEAVPAVHQHEYAAQVRPSAQILFEQPVPCCNFGFALAGIAIARQIHQPRGPLKAMRLQAGGQHKKVKLLRAPRRV